VQGLCNGNGFDGGKTHDDFVLEGCVLHPIEGVLVVVGEYSCSPSAVMILQDKMLIICCFAWRKTGHWVGQPYRISHTLF
jgi:hypothetical protein